MPEAVIVATARSPIGRAFKGSLKDLRPDDLTATIVRAALDKVPAARPDRHRRPDARLRPARRRAGLQHGPRRQRPARHGPPARDDDHPLLLVVAADHPHGDARDQGRRGRRLHLRRRRDGLPVRQGQQRLAARHPEPGVRRRRGPGRPRSPRAAPTAGATRARTATSPTSTSRWARPRRTSRCSRTSPGRRWTSSPSAARTSPRRPSTTASGRGRSPRSPLPDGTVVSHGRRPARRDHARGPVPAQAGVPAGRPGHRGQRLPAQRRRRRRGRHERHQGRASSA